MPSAELDYWELKVKADRGHEAGDRIDAVKKLGLLKYPLAVPTLITLLDDDLVGNDAILALANQADARAAASVRKFLNRGEETGEWPYTMNAVHALGRMRDAASRERILQLLKDNRVPYTYQLGVQSNALLALGAIGDERDLALLARMLRSRKLKVLKSSAIGGLKDACLAMKERKAEPRNAVTREGRIMAEIAKHARTQTSADAIARVFADVLAEKASEQSIRVYLKQLNATQTKNG